VQGLADVGVFPSDARTIFDAIGAKDKTLELVKGAHYFEDSRAEREEVAALVAQWVAARC